MISTFYIRTYIKISNKQHTILRHGNSGIQVKLIFNKFTFEFLPNTVINWYTVVGRYIYLHLCSTLQHAEGGDDVACVYSPAMFVDVDATDRIHSP